MACLLAAESREENSHVAVNRAATAAGTMTAAATRAAARVGRAALATDPHVDSGWCWRLVGWWLEEKRNLWIHAPRARLICISDAANERRLNGIVPTGERVGTVESRCEVSWVSESVHRTAFILSCRVSWTIPPDRAVGRSTKNLEHNSYVTEHLDIC